MTDAEKVLEGRLNNLPPRGSFFWDHTQLWEYWFERVSRYKEHGGDLCRLAREGGCDDTGDNYGNWYREQLAHKLGRGGDRRVSDIESARLRDLCPAAYDAA